jgi:hypothetical protein
MSDGNYNRNLLPYTQYRSGHKAGQAQMRVKALTAFDAWYAARHPESTAEEKAHARTEYAVYLAE